MALRRPGLPFSFLTQLPLWLQITPIWFPAKGAKRLGRIGNVVQETHAGA